jgi:hypothetical protein
MGYQVEQYCQPTLQQAHYGCRGSSNTYDHAEVHTNASHQFNAFDTAHEQSAHPNYDHGLPPSYNNSILNSYMVPPQTFPSTFPMPSPNHDKLIAIPATAHKVGSPIMRAWPPVLERTGLSKADFIDFIDRLNRATVDSPPIQVLGLVGNVVGMVPLATAQIVGGAVNMGAMVAGAAVRMGHTEILLREANRDLFQPLGLKVKLAKMSAVAKMAGIPIMGLDGKFDKKSHLLPPLGYDGGSHQSIGVHQRRLMALQPYLSPLEYDGMPELEQPSNSLLRMHQAVSVRAAAKEERRMMKKRSSSRKDKEEKVLRKLIFLVVDRI